MGGQKEYWSNITGIPLSQFNKTILIKAKNKKVYENFKVYYGVLAVSVRRSSELQYLIFGLIQALQKDNARVSL